MQINRFIITEKETGKWVASVFAQRFEPYDGTGGHFFLCDQVVGSAELTQHQVSISGIVGASVPSPSKVTVNVSGGSGSR